MKEHTHTEIHPCMYSMSIPQCTKGPSALVLLQSRYMLEPANSSEMRPARASRPRLAWPPAATWTCSTGAPTATRSWAETSRAPGAGSGGAWGSVCFRQLGRSEVPIFGWFSCLFPFVLLEEYEPWTQPRAESELPPIAADEKAVATAAANTTNCTASTCTHTHTTQRNTNPIAHPPTATAGTGTTGNTGRTGNTGNTGKTGNTGTTGNRDNSEHRENREHRDHRATRTAGHVNRKTSAARSGRAQGRTHVNQRFRKLRYVTSDHYMVDLESGSVTDFGSMEDAKAACETMGTVPRGSRRVGRAAKRAHHLRNPTE